MINKKETMHLENWKVYPEPKGIKLPKNMVFNILSGCIAYYGTT
jgi:hypothetical protein